MEKHHLPLGIVVALAAASPASAVSESWSSPATWLQAAPLALRLEWTEHALGRFAPQTGTSAGLRLIESGVVDFSTAVKRAGRERLAHPLLRLAPEAGAVPVSTALGATLGTETLGFAVVLGDVPVCGFHVRAHRAADGTFAIFGALPTVSAGAPVGADAWPARDEAELAARVEIAQNEADHLEDIAVVSASRCYAIHDAALHAAWSFTLEAPKGRWASVADEATVFDRAERSLAIDGSAHVYERHAKDGARVRIPLPGLDGTGTLAGERIFLTAVHDEPAKAANHDFDFPETDDAFQQASAYAHVQRHVDYFEGLGYEWPQGQRLRINWYGAESAPGGPQYFPYYGKDGLTGSIDLEKGDGRVLQNLAVDADAIKHEFGHQVVSTTLTELRRCIETLVIHEGLADFFVAAANADPCLGPTICPDGSSICAMRSQCLRNASIAFKRNDPSWNAAFSNPGCYSHKHGQLISGLLYDVARLHEVPLQDVARITLRATQLFKADSGFRDLMLALLFAERELFGGVHAPAFRRAMEGRGWDDLIADVPNDATSALPPLAGGGKSGPPTLPTEPQAPVQEPKLPTPPPAASKDEKKKSACGVAGEVPEAATSGLPVALLLVLAVPLLMQRRMRL